MKMWISGFSRRKSDLTAPAHTFSQEAECTAPINWSDHTLPPFAERSWGLICSEETRAVSSKRAQLASGGPPAV